MDRIRCNSCNAESYHGFDSTQTYCPTCWNRLKADKERFCVALQEIKKYRKQLSVNGMMDIYKIAEQALKAASDV